VSPGPAQWKAGVLGHCEQAVDILNGSVGASHTEQRFEAFELAGREPVDGLVEEGELPLVEGCTQLALTLLLAGNADLEVLVENFVASRPACLARYMAKSASRSSRSDEVCSGRPWPRRC